MSEPDPCLIVERVGDSLAFTSTVTTLARAIVRLYGPARIYMVRVDNWFGPKWLHFSGKKLGSVSLYRERVTIPPFVPERVEQETVFSVPSLTEETLRSPLHLDCTSEFALSRYLDEYDSVAAFIWFSSQSTPQQRGSAMVYLPGKNGDGNFYVSFVQQGNDWTVDVVTGVSRAELSALLILHETQPEGVHA